MTTNSQLAHQWAACGRGTTDKTRGQTSNGNMSYEGSRLYSYSTVIAKFVKDGAGRNLYVLCSRYAYSMTTVGKHYSARSGALHGLGVPAVYVDVVREVSPDAIISELLFAANVCLDKATRAHRYAASHRDDAVEFVAQAAIVANAHGLPIEALEAHRERLARERGGRLVWQRLGQFFAEYNEAARDVFEAPLRALLEINTAVHWMANDRRYWPGLGHFGPTLLRVKGATVETSRGAEFPLEHGLKALPFIRLAMHRHGYFSGGFGTQNGDTPAPRLGHFKVDRVSADGTVTAGCHTVPLFAIRWAARQAGHCEAPELDHVAEAVSQARSALATS